jgi:hypothetical protein
VIPNADQVGKGSLPSDEIKQLPADAKGLRPGPRRPLREGRALPHGAPDRALPAPRGRASA